jgi:hypothetical protein
MGSNPLFLSEGLDHPEPGNQRGRCARTADLNPAIIIFHPLDIVFPKVFAGLNFDENQILLSRILDAMPGSHRQIDSLAHSQLNLATVLGDHAPSGNNGPMFRPLIMPLVTEALAGINRDPFDLVIRLIREDFIKSPGPMVFLHLLSFPAAI